MKRKEFLWPIKENNTKRYIQFIKKMTGVKENIKIKDYSKADFSKLWAAIEKFEGQIEGKIKEYSTNGQITKVKKDKRGKIKAYLVDGFGWIVKSKAIALTSLKKIDAVIVKRGSTVFLRSRPNNIDSDNLDNKV